MENLQSALRDVVINAGNGDPEAQEIISKVEREARREQFLKENYLKWNEEGMELRARRLKHNMSLNYVAEKLGTSASRIGRLEKGLPVSQAKHLIASYNLLFDYIELRKDLKAFYSDHNLKWGL
ncbi:hypothetical protein GCM10011409_20100 [Lentibacillus populi]|uniref:HTH cro/C1-type domain-containing protein n=1 Tax=Lentibacillus populi TaxID=1827502 RepID=A0A9W5X5C0_9BACI|nr:helix-turn-helix transcriptional regulator [Lentibacillus populi]GGB42498.1 hypothetical protein GCM10011409_20100 [Lentibacillus populi]